MPASSRPLLVIGHKNPDTDSICAALSYADLKSRHHGEPAEACRAGNLNEQTSFVLEHYGIEPPRLITDVYPKVSDIMVKGDALIVLRHSDPLERARSLMIERRFTFLPVAGPDGRCAGRITALRLAGLAGDFLRLESRTVTLDPVGLAQALPGSLLSPNGGAKVQGPLVAAGSARPDASGGVHVIAGCPGALRAALSRKAAMVVLCGGSEPEPEAAAAAASAGVPVIRTVRDVPAAVVGILLLQPLSDYLEDTPVTLGEMDLVRNAIRVMASSNEGGFIVTDDRKRIRGVITRVSLLDRGRFRLALVDHNELSQAVDGAEDADIVEIIDHHRLGARSTDGPITFINRVVGSTCTIVADLYRTQGHRPEPKMAGIMLAAMLSDTLIMRSPTTTDMDRKTAVWLSEIAGVDPDKFGERMFEAGSALEGVEPATLLAQDRKLYEESGIRFAASQIEIVGFGRFDAIRCEVAQELDRYLASERLDFGCLLVTDLTSETSLLLCAGDKRVIGAIGYPRVGERLFEMKGVLSRKKQLLPYLLDVIRGAV